MHDNISRGVVRLIYLERVQVPDSTPILTGVGAVATGAPRGASSPTPTNSPNHPKHAFMASQKGVVMILFVVICLLLS